MKYKVKPNVVRGGRAIDLGNNLFLMSGRTHARGGIDIGRNPRTGLEVENNEVMQITPNTMRVFSAQPILNGKSPAQRVLDGANPTEVFNAQEYWKKVNGVRDDGTKATFGKLFDFFGSLKGKHAVKRNLTKVNYASNSDNNEDDEVFDIEPAVVVADSMNGTDSEGRPLLTKHDANRFRQRGYMHNALFRGHNIDFANNGQINFYDDDPRKAIERYSLHKKKIVGLDYEHRKEREALNTLKAGFIGDSYEPNFIQRGLSNAIRKVGRLASDNKDENKISKKIEVTNPADYYAHSKYVPDWYVGNSDEDSYRKRKDRQIFYSFKDKKGLPLFEAFDGVAGTWRPQIKTDEDGREYIALYDKNDLTGTGMNIDKFMGNSSDFYLYDRIYFDELSKSEENKLRQRVAAKEAEYQKKKNDVSKANTSIKQAVKDYFNEKDFNFSTIKDYFNEKDFSFSKDNIFRYISEIKKRFPNVSIEDIKKYVFNANNKKYGGGIHIKPSKLGGRKKAIYGDEEYIPGLKVIWNQGSNNTVPHSYITSDGRNFGLDLERATRAQQEINNKEARRNFNGPNPNYSNRAPGSSIELGSPLSGSLYSSDRGSLYTPNSSSGEPVVQSPSTGNVHITTTSNSAEEPVVETAPTPKPKKKGSSAPATVQPQTRSTSSIPTPFDNNLQGSVSRVKTYSIPTIQGRPTPTMHRYVDAPTTIGEPTNVTGPTINQTIAGGPRPQSGDSPKTGLNRRQRLKRAFKDLKDYAANNPDAIGLGINLAGNLAASLINRNTINNLRSPEAPVPLRAEKLKTRYNTRPQEAAIRENQARSEQLVADNTASSQTRLGRTQGLRNTALGQYNMLAGQRENIETQLINQDRMNRQQVGNQNVGLYNDWRNRYTQFENNRDLMNAENSVAGINNAAEAIAGQNGYIARKEKRELMNTMLDRDILNLELSNILNPNATPLTLKRQQEVLDAFYDRNPRLRRRTLRTYNTV